MITARSRKRKHKEKKHVLISCHQREEHKLTTQQGHNDTRGKMIFSLCRYVAQVSGLTLKSRTHPQTSYSYSDQKFPYNDYHDHHCDFKWSESFWLPIVRPLVVIGKPPKILTEVQQYPYLFPVSWNSGIVHAVKRVPQRLTRKRQQHH